MKIAAFRYSSSGTSPINLGDYIQTLAVTQHLPHVDFYLDRDRLNEYEGEDCLVVMNGWFSNRPEAWPPSPRIHPIFHGFHMTAKAQAVYARHLDYFRKHQPIGCRDRSTYEQIRNWGIDAYISLCCTLTFPTRLTQPKEPCFIGCDVQKRWLRSSLRKQTISVTHNMPPLDYTLQLEYARAILALYRDRASHVITSRIHAAMPCMAMGIPVLYIGRRNPRTDILTDVGVPERYIWNKVSPLLAFRKLGITTDSFYQPRLEQLKADITGKLRERLRQFGVG